MCKHHLIERVAVQQLTKVVAHYLISSNWVEADQDFFDPQTVI